MSGHYQPNYSIQYVHKINAQDNAYTTEVIIVFKVGGILPGSRTYLPFNGVLEINPILPEDTGFYSCSSSVADKTVTHVFYLDVLCRNFFTMRNIKDFQLNHIILFLNIVFPI